MEGGKRRLELDFVCLAEGRLLAGEAKANGTLGNAEDAAKEVTKTVRGARLLEADRVVFATTEPTWTRSWRPSQPEPAAWTRRRRS